MHFYQYLKKIYLKEPSGMFVCFLLLPPCVTFTFTMPFLFVLCLQAASSKGNVC